MSTCDIVSPCYTKCDMQQAYLCKNCGTLLTSQPERLDGDWVLPCPACGVKNIVVAVLKVIGWRP